MNTIDDSRTMQLPKIADDRGNLTFVESERHVPFLLQRAYWIYDVPGGEYRGGHANRTLREFVIALSGSFDVALDDGENSKVVALNRSYLGLYVPPGIWRQFRNFSTNAVALILASGPYDENDYIRDHDDYVRFRSIPHDH
jgi:dTDP-4-dehydrorhamnose 3,5-epimerase-like enzyme